MRKAPILVVDDDLDTLAMMKIILEDEGYRVLTTPCGREALAIIEQERPACLLLDLALPNVDGRTVAQVLHTVGVDFPIILMTAVVDARYWAGEIGATTYLSKPCDLDEVVQTVARLTGGPARQGDTTPVVH